MKKLSNLKGAKALSKKEQQSINGGVFSRCVKALVDIYGNVVCAPGYTYNPNINKCCPN